ncbi:MAG: hypothetical protein DRG82_16555 [Deltaproteobacteria bacterium]|nr:MAG: hypothetical protein DRG82_16555 [Deltaproteobacteria bacterium]
MNKDLKDYYPQRRRILRTRAEVTRSRLRRFMPPWILSAIILFSLSAVFFWKEESLPENKFSAGTACTISEDNPVLAKTALSLEHNKTNRELLTAVDELPREFQARDKVKRGDTFETILKRNSIDREYLLPLVKAARPVYNLNRVIIGREFNFTFAEGQLTHVEYEIDEDRNLLLTRKDSTSWQARLEPTVWQINERILSGRIRSSLYESVMEIYGDPELALSLSEIYAWQIDFHNDIRKGDTFKLIFEEKIHPRGTRKIGKILAAVFHNAGKTFWAIRFTNADSTFDYFDLQGRNLRRKFLRSPFKYMPRISSRFSYRRFHPILKRYRPHLGVDYAAPTGTPVLALGDGRVVFRGWKGGFGRFIKIKHNGMYSTSYGHLSRYAKNIKVGTWVTQGQVIGYVGSTGLATGPHLDFRFYKNGTPVNPLTVDIPAGEPIHPSIADKYAAYCRMIIKKLESSESQDYRPTVTIKEISPGQNFSRTENAEE